MSLVSRLTQRSLENPGTPLTSSGIMAILGGGRATASGAHITPDNVLRIGAALRATQIVAGSIAGLPLKVYRESNGVRTEVKAPAINGHNGYQTAYERWEQTVAHMILWGNAYLWKVRGRSGVVERLIPIHPSRVLAEVVDERDFGGLVRRYTVDGRTMLTAYEVMHLPCMTLDGVKGIGPIEATREMFGTAVAAEHAAGKLFGQGLMLAGFLTTDEEIKDEKRARALKRRWRETLQGAENAGDVGLLDKGAKYQSLAMPAKDAQFLESRKFSVTEIARLIGVPGWMMNDQEKSTSWGTGMEQQFATWVITTLRAYMSRIEQRVSLELLPDPQDAEFKVEGLLRGDSAARAAFYNAGITGGWLTPNDVRHWENMPPVEWGDEPYLPHNQSADAQSDTSGTEPPPDDSDDPEEDES